MRDDDLIKALRCLASQDGEGDCYETYYNLMNPDKQRISCSGGYGDIPCPYHQNKYGVCFEDGECGEWLKTVADELEKVVQIGNDLISRSALLDALRGNVLVDVTSRLEEAIREQPAVYDVKVQEMT